MSSFRILVLFIKVRYGKAAIKKEFQKEEKVSKKYQEEKVSAPACYRIIRVTKESIGS